MPESASSSALDKHARAPQLPGLVWTVQRTLACWQRKAWVTGMRDHHRPSWNGSTKTAMPCMANSVLGNKYNPQHVGTLLSHTP
jgi:hypothetical protein